MTNVAHKTLSRTHTSSQNEEESDLNVACCTPSETNNTWERDTPSCKDRLNARKQDHQTIDNSGPYFIILLLLYSSSAFFRYSY